MHDASTHYTHGRCIIFDHIYFYGYFLIKNCRLHICISRNRQRH